MTASPYDLSGSLVPDLLAGASQRFHDKVAVDANGDELTFAQLSRRASLLAGALIAHGITKGGRVALLAMNDREYLEIRVGCRRAGAILVPLNYRLLAAELAAQLEDAAAELLIVGRGLERLAEALPIPASLRLGDGSYEEAITAADPVPVAAGHPPEEICEICYTSGTTGRPKGVMLSHRAVHASTIAMGHEIGATPDSIFLACTPMFHVGSQVGSSCTFLGASQVQLQRFDVPSFLDAVDRTSPTHTQIVPTMLRLLVDAWGDRPPPSLRRIMYGAAPMPPALLAELTEVWDCEFVNGYGTTEAMGISFLTPAEHRWVRRLSVGRGSTVTVSRVIDEAGHDVPVGEVGEIVARGPTLMSGYWRNSKATREVLVHGWLHTGDLGYRDEDGFLHLVDRRGDKIITGGENVFPSEVEHTLESHPEVAEAAVIGVADRTWGEAVVAVVVPRQGTDIDTLELARHCRSALPGYKVPKEFRLSSEPLPRTATGKLQRHRVRSAFATHATQ